MLGTQILLWFAGVVQCQSIYGISMTLTTQESTPSTIPARLIVPASTPAGQWPAVVMAHASGGLYRYDDPNQVLETLNGRWAETCLARNWVCIYPDSFTSRGGSANADQVTVRPFDIWAAVQFLTVATATDLQLTSTQIAALGSSLPINRSRIFLLGWGGGASAVFAAISTTNSFCTQLPVARAFAFYPFCGLNSAFSGITTSRYCPCRPFRILHSDKNLTTYDPLGNCEKRLTRANDPAICNATTFGQQMTMTRFAGAKDRFDEWDTDVADGWTTADYDAKQAADNEVFAAVDGTTTTTTTTPPASTSTNSAPPSTTSTASISRSPSRTPSKSLSPTTGASSPPPSTTRSVSPSRSLSPSISLSSTISRSPSRSPSPSTSPSTSSTPSSSRTISPSPSSSREKIPFYQWPNAAYKEVYVNLTTNEDIPTTIQSSLIFPQPSSTGPWPAILFVHGSGGLYSTAYQGSLLTNFVRWASACHWFGIICLFPDSYTARGGKQNADEVNVRPYDVRAGLKFLYAESNAQGMLAGLDTARIYLVGWSHGGSTIMSSINNGPHCSNFPVAAAFAFYPGCGLYAAFGGITNSEWCPCTPLTIMPGSLDPLYTSGYCDTRLARAKLEAVCPSDTTAGQKADMVVMQGAQHSYDQADDGVEWTQADRDARDAGDQIVLNAVLPPAVFCPDIVGCQSCASATTPRCQLCEPGRLLQLGLGPRPDSCKLIASCVEAGCKNGSTCRATQPPELNGKFNFTCDCTGTGFTGRVCDTPVNCLQSVHFAQGPGVPGCVCADLFGPGPVRYEADGVPAGCYRNTPSDALSASVQLSSVRKLLPSPSGLQAANGTVLLEVIAVHSDGEVCPGLTANKAAMEGVAQVELEVLFYACSINGSISVLQVSSLGAINLQTSTASLTLQGQLRGWVSVRAFQETTPTSAITSKSRTQLDVLPSAAYLAIILLFVIVLLMSCYYLRKRHKEQRCKPMSRAPSRGGSLRKMTTDSASVSRLPGLDASRGRLRGISEILRCPGLDNSRTPAINQRSLENSGADRLSSSGERDALSSSGRRSRGLSEAVDFGPEGYVAPVTTDLPHHLSSNNLEDDLRPQLPQFQPRTSLIAEEAQSLAELGIALKQPVQISLPQNLGVVESGDHPTRVVTPRHARVRPETPSTPTTGDEGRLSSSGDEGRLSSSGSNMSNSARRRKLQEGSGANPSSPLHNQEGGDEGRLSSSGSNMSNSARRRKLQEGSGANPSSPLQNQEGVDGSPSSGTRRSRANSKSKEKTPHSHTRVAVQVVDDPSANARLRADVPARSVAVFHSCDLEITESRRSLYEVTR
eukprot:g2205.t1